MTGYGLVELASSIEEIGDVAKNKDKHYDNSKFLLTCFNSVLQINLCFTMALRNFIKTIIHWGAQKNLTVSSSALIGRVVQTISLKLSV